MKTTFLITTFALIANLSFSQKLPNVQQGSMRAPANVKVDGKITEWGEMRAYNKTTQIYYTLANDAEMLYLTLKTPSLPVLEKIVKGGVTLRINIARKKKADSNPMITFPMYEQKPLFDLGLNERPDPTDDAERDRLLRDSIAREKNKQLGGYMKWIGTLNLTGITDSLISVYNDDDIKVAYAIDDQLCYNYELAVPLKRLGLSASAIKFYYNLQLNGASFYFVSVREIRPNLFTMIDANGKAQSYSTDPDAPVKIFPNDFWGDYTLAQ